MSVALTGSQPWNITYTDGSTPITVNGITSSPYTFSTGNLVNAGTTTAATTYSITALSDANCTANASDYTTTAVVTVNPVPSVVDPADLVVCAGNNFNATVFTGAVSGTVFNWTNDNQATGLGASGTGDISSFTSINNTSSAIVSNVTVTPVFGSNPTCTGTPQTFSLTVNPVPFVQDINTTICSGGSYSITPTDGSGNIIPAGGPGPGTHYTWSAPVVSGLSGMLSASGASSFVSGTLVNSTNAPLTVVYTVTPNYDNTPAFCPGLPFTVTITVNPTPDVADPTDQVLCVGS